MKRNFKWRELLQNIVIVVVIVGAFVIPAYVERRISDSQLTVSCISAEANIKQLHALRAVATELGLPARFEIPVLPPECAPLEEE